MKLTVLLDDAPALALISAAEPYGIVAEKLEEQKVAGPLTPAKAHIELRLNHTNDWHALEHGEEGRGGAVCGGPAGTADMLQYTEPQEPQIINIGC